MGASPPIALSRTIAIVVLPLFSLYPSATLVVLLGASIGSLIPDADSPDAAIFHSEVRGVGDLLNAPAILFPPFGYVTKYLIYKPAVIFYDRVVFDEYEIRERHRGFSHSFLGLGTITIVTAAYLIPVLYVLGLLWIAGVILFLIGYLAGALLHLVEDSCTKSGIQWNFPFADWRVSGELRTAARIRDMWYQRGFLGVLAIGVIGAFFAPTMISQVPVIVFSILGSLLVVLLWAAFTLLVAKCEVT